MPRSLLLKAHAEVFNYGRILMDTAARLAQHGFDVAALESRLINSVPR